MDISAMKSGLLQIGGIGAAQPLSKQGVDNSLQAQLEKIVKQTPAERMRDSILKKIGVTEEELAQMPPKERDAVTQQIAEMVKQAMELEEDAPKQGVFVNTSA